MNYKLLLPVAAILASAPLLAQQENWDTYMAKFGSKPGSVMVDMGLMQSAPEKLLPYLVVTGPHAKNCPAYSGIPDSSELNRLEHMLSVTSGILTGATAKKLAGTFTYNCERVNYYYVKDTGAIRVALARMYKNYYPDYDYTLKIKQDPLWVTYRTFLYPDSAASAWMRNNKTMLALLEKGDDLTVPRPIKNTLMFKEDSARTQFIRFALKNRYEVSLINTTGGLILPFEVTVARRAVVNMDSIMAMESELIAISKKLDGYYKGWDASK